MDNVCTLIYLNMKYLTVCFSIQATTVQLVIYIDIYIYFFKLTNFFSIQNLRSLVSTEKLRMCVSGTLSTFVLLHAI